MAQGIPVAASLALAVKLKKMFEEEDRFLAFPVGLGFPKDYFDFMKGPGETPLSAQDQSNFKGDFARLMNMIPDDKPLFSPDASALLWDRMREVLRDCKFAESALSDAEEARLAEAIDFLTDDVVGEDGVAITVMSPQVRKYYEYKTVYDEADIAYREAKLSVDFADGPEGEQLRRAWAEYREVELLAARDKAMQDWVNLGFKAAVEQHRAVQNALEVRKYLEVYRQAYLSEMQISEISDVAGRGVDYLNTFFSPLDAFEPEKPWASVTLTKSEMAGLIAEAPGELRAMFGGVQEADRNLEAISLEYSKVVIIRPWYRDEFFSSRHWRLPDGRMLCDGGSPRGGPLPAYITNMVVARNVHMVRRKDAPPAPAPSTRPDIPLQVIVRDHRAKIPARPGVIVRDHRSGGASGPAARVRDHRGDASSGVTVRVRDHRTAQPDAPMARVRDHRTRTVQEGGTQQVRVRDHRTRMVQEGEPQQVRVRPAAAVQPSAAVRSGVARPQVAIHPAMLQARSSFVHSAAFAKVTAEPMPQLQVRPSYELAKLHGLTIRAPVNTVVPSRRADTRLETGTPTESETVALDGFSVLALTCKRLPRCPNPDAGLRWV